MAYADYKHLLGQAYTSGDHDCYGLAVRYYRDLFGMELTNIARPDGWWDHPEITIVQDGLFVDGWEDIGVNLRNLKVGDALIFSLISGRMNHIGIYVGNGLFIHHIYKMISREDPLVQKWMSRCLAVLRHKTVTAVLQNQLKKVDLLEVVRNGKR